jgi:hypothetical protein
VKTTHGEPAAGVMAEPVVMVPGRVCGSCSLCCKLLRIEELDKPAGRWCCHCTAGRDGCKIYDTRPGSCRSFHCTWLINPELGAEWRPTTAKMVLYYDPPARRLAVHVDPEFPSAWRSEPYYRQLKAWTCAAIDCAHALARCLVDGPDSRVRRRQGGRHASEQGH